MLEFRLVLNSYYVKLLMIFVGFIELYKGFEVGFWWLGFE